MSREDDPVLIQTEKGVAVLCKGISLYPAGDPREYARRKAGAFPIAPRTLVFVPSVGLGYGFAELLARLPADCAVICVEAHQQIMALALTQELPVDSRLSILRADDPAEPARALERLGISRFRRVVELPLSAGYRLAQGFYSEARRALEAAVQTHWRNRITLVALGSLMVRNLLDNLELLPSSGDLASLSTEMPVVVAGAGPSLDECVPAMRALRDRFVLMAVDTALPALASHALAPDLVIVLEAQAANMEDFLPARPAGTLAACELSSFPPAARLFGGRRLFFASELAPLGIFDRLDSALLLPRRIPPLGSVGIAAAYAALRMTTGDVYLAGLDFSFPGLRTHARGTAMHIASLASASRMNTVDQDSLRALCSRARVRIPDKHGEPVDTSPVLASYRDGLERSLRGDGDRTWDISPIGLSSGARPLSAIELEQRLAGSPDRSDGRRLEVRKVPPVSPDRIRGFLVNEADLLEKASACMREGLSTGALSSEGFALLRAVDYSYLHFADQPDAAQPGKSFLARAAVAAGYYRQRIERIIRRMS